MNELLELVSLCKCSVNVRVNEHKSYYEGVLEFIESVDGRDRVLEGDLETMIATDIVYSVQAYPHTPNGFYIIYGASLDRVVSAMLKTIKEVQA